MYEKRFKAVPLQAFTANGNTVGQVTIADTTLFKVKQVVILSATGQPDLTLEVKRVDSRTIMYVGPTTGNIDTRTDISLYTTAASAGIFANEQKRTSIPEQDVERNTYEEEPVVARRVTLVDPMGDKYDATNPLPVAAVFDGDVQVGDIRITAVDDDPVAGNIHSSVRISDGVDDLAINPDGSINVVVQTGSTASPTLANVTILLANTEYSYVFPTGTKQFTLKDRKGDAKTRYSYTLGGTSGVYGTLDVGCTYPVTGISTPVGFTIYMQSSKPNRIIEIVSWA